MQVKGLHLPSANAKPALQLSHCPPAVRSCCGRQVWQSEPPTHLHGLHGLQATALTKTQINPFQNFNSWIGKNPVLAQVQFSRCLPWSWPNAPQHMSRASSSANVRLASEGRSQLIS